MTQIASLLIRAGLITGLAFGLAACSSEVDQDRSILQRLSASQGGPDEFLVIARAPLQLPSDIRSLPAPQPGAPSLVEPNARNQLLAALGASATGQTSPMTDGQRAFVAAASAGPVPANLRAQIIADNEEVREFGGLFSVIIPGGLTNPFRDQQLDPIEEAARLRATYPGIVIPTPPTAQ